MTHAIKGLNLGGWLVAEKWMTPSLFEGTDAQNEYELSLFDEGKEKLGQHHLSFIDETDLQWIASKGIKVLRVPVGYWIFGDADPYIGAIDRLDWLMEASEKLGLEIIIDLHGAPEAQNDRDHSGSGNVPRTSKWLRNRDAKSQTIAVLEKLARRYRESTNLWGIEIVNEPSAGRTALRLTWFYRKAYRALTQVARPGTRIILSDAFHPWLITNAVGFWKKRLYPVVLDCHFYQCFSEKDKGRTFDGHLRLASSRRRTIKWLSLMQPVMVGEWSGALPTEVSMAGTKQFVDTQRLAYEDSILECYWSYKTENGGPWSFRDVSEKGMVQ